VASEWLLKEKLLQLSENWQLLIDPLIKAFRNKSPAAPPAQFWCVEKPGVGIG